MGEAKRKKGKPLVEVLDEATGYEGIEPAADPDEAPDKPEEEEQKPIELRTAGLVLTDVHGVIAVCTNIEADVVLNRMSTPDDIYAAMVVLGSGLPYIVDSVDETEEEVFDTGFLMTVGRDGMRFATNEINQPYVLDRHITTHDVRLCSAVITKDILVMEAANAALQLQMQTAAQIAEKQRVAQVQAAIEQNIKGGLHVPGGVGRRR